MYDGHVVSWSSTSLDFFPCTQINPDERDWRKELLTAVEQVLNHERLLLSTAVGSSLPDGGVAEGEATIGGREAGKSGVNLQTLHDQVQGD